MSLYIELKKTLVSFLEKESDDREWVSEMV